MRNHQVYFYSDDKAFVENVAKFVAPALLGGNGAIVFATKPHRESIVRALQLQGINIDAAIENGVYVSLDAAETLAMFMVNGWPDRAQFFQGFSKLIESASKAAAAQTPRIAVFGEGVALLCDEGKTEAAIQLEQLGNELSNKFEVDILCAYPLSLCTQQREYAVKRICAEHSAVYSG